MKKDAADMGSVFFWRSSVNRKNGIKIICLLVLCSVAVCSGKKVIGAEEKDQVLEALASRLHAKSAVLMDGDSGKVLFEKNMGEILPMASTTKIMTCILALEYGEMRDIVTVTKEAAAMPKVHLGMQEQEQFYLKDLLYSMMLESHNDSAAAIAIHIGGSLKGFASLMNKKAASLGCVNTYFITPNGLDENDENGMHSTTAYDLAKIMKYCVFDSPERNMFRKICQAKEYQFTDIVRKEKERKRSFYLSNHNALLSMNKGVLAGKTGFTGKAGYCYVGAVQEEDKNLVFALLACGWPNKKTYKWQDSKALITFAKEHCIKINIQDYRNDSAIPVITAGKEGRVLKAGIKKKEMISNEKMLIYENEKLFCDYIGSKQVVIPVYKEERIGKLVLCAGKEKLYQWNVVSLEEIRKAAFPDVLFQICYRFCTQIE